MPVVVEAGFDLEGLAGEAEVVGGAAGDRLDFAPGFPGGLPDGCLGRIGHADGTAQVVGVNVVERGGFGNGQRQVDGAVVVCAEGILRIRSIVVVVCG